MNLAKILVIDDEQSVREFVKDVLGEHYSVHLAANGKEGREAAIALVPDVIILDLLMPQENGIEVTAQLRSHQATSHIPILMLTALNEPEQRIQAFSVGVDDYLAKPFHPDELLVRVKAKLIRIQERKAASPGQGEPLLRLGNIVIHLAQQKIEILGKDIPVGGVEFKLLYVLATNEGRIVQRQTIENFIWDGARPAERALDPHVLSLRRKLRASNMVLQTSYGNGYALIPQHEVDGGLHA